MNVDWFFFVSPNTTNYFYFIRFLFLAKQQNIYQVLELSISGDKVINHIQQD